jgi:transposase
VQAASTGLPPVSKASTVLSLGSLATSVARCRSLTIEIGKLEREITELVETLTPTLLAICGCGPLTAAKILGETAGVERFKSPDAYARHNGTAPCPTS